MNYAVLKFYLRACAFLTLICFTCNSVLYSAPALPSVASVASHPATPFIIHIQDAHSDPTAQRDIARILQDLQERENVDLVLVEAASGALDAQYLQWTQSPELNRSMAERLTEMGEMSGADIYLARHGNSVPIVGIETPALYRSNLEAFKNVWAQEKQTTDWLAGSGQRLHLEIGRLGNATLRSLLKVYLGWKESEPDVAAVFRVLCPSPSQSRGRGIKGEGVLGENSQPDYPSLIRYLRLHEEASGIRSERAWGEWAILQQKYSLDSNWQKKFFADQLAENPRYALEKLYALIAPKGFQFKQYPQLVKYLRSRIYQYEIVPANLNRELNQWMEELFREAAHTEQEKELVSRISGFRQLRKLLRLEMTREEWDSFCHSERSEESGLRHLDSSPALRRTQNDRKYFFDAAINFYHLAVLREEAFVQNIETLIRQHRAQKVVVITGGFHAQAMAKQYRKRHYPFRLITPRVGSASQTLYVRTLMGRSAKAPATSELASVPQAVSPVTAASLGVDRARRGRLLELLAQRLTQPITTETLMGYLRAPMFLPDGCSLITQIKNIRTGQARFVRHTLRLKDQLLIQYAVETKQWGTLTRAQRNLLVTSMQNQTPVEISQQSGRRRDAVSQSVRAALRRLRKNIAPHDSETIRRAHQFLSEHLGVTDAPQIQAALTEVFTLPPHRMSTTSAKGSSLGRKVSQVAIAASLGSGPVKIKLGQKHGFDLDYGTGIVFDVAAGNSQEAMYHFLRNIGLSTDNIIRCSFVVVGCNAGSVSMAAPDADSLKVALGSGTLSFVALTIVYQISGALSLLTIPLLPYEDDQYNIMIPWLFTHILLPLIYKTIFDIKEPLKGIALSSIKGASHGNRLVQPAAIDTVNLDELKEITIENNHSTADAHSLGEAERSQVVEELIDGDGPTTGASLGQMVNAVLHQLRQRGVALDDPEAFRRFLTGRERAGRGDIRGMLPVIIDVARGLPAEKDNRHLPPINSEPQRVVSRGAEAMIIRFQGQAIQRQPIAFAA
ncbi:MAG: hypothetical protein HY586_07450 [Candidatus Omnitrophica bacterium]|nr:hypothetical protein [Candidatus Omnitrophota bacterium]